jgi:hypothetical protein
LHITDTARRTKIKAPGAKKKRKKERYLAFNGELSHASNKIKGKQVERNLAQWKISDSETKMGSSFVRIQRLKELKISAVVV